MNKKCLGLLCLILLLGSCAMEKRHYRPGFFIQWRNQSVFHENNNSISDSLTATFSSSLKNEVALTIPETKVPCDTIKLLNGTILSVRITNYNPNKVSYLACDKKSVNKQVINAHDVEYLKMEDGTVIEMTNKNQKKGFTPAVYVAMIAAVLALVVILLQWWIPSVILVSLAGNFSWFGLVQMYNRDNKVGMMLMTVIWAGTIFVAIVGIINLIHMLT